MPEDVAGDLEGHRPPFRLTSAQVWRAEDDGAAGPVNVAPLINACSRPAGERHIPAQPVPTHTQAVGIPAGRFTGAPAATGGGFASGESIHGVVRGLQPHQPDSLVNNIANPCVGVGLDSAICNGVSNVVSGPGITDAAGRDVFSLTGLHRQPKPLSQMNPMTWL